MKVRQYSVLIMRYEDDEQTEILDKYITADEAIDLMLHIQEDFHSSQEEVIEEEAEDEPEPVLKKTLKEVMKPKSAKRAGAKCGKCGEFGHNARTCSGPKTGDGLTNYERRKQARKEETLSEDPTLAELDRMAAEGLSQVELQEMFPSVPLFEIIKAHERHNHI